MPVIVGVAQLTHREKTEAQLDPAIDLSIMPRAKQAAGMASMLPSVRELFGALLRDFGLPADGLSAMNLIRRTFPVGEFPTEKALITKALGGSPI